ncbi:MAG: InlB B-repeat-containing protein [Bacteroidales bacterium]|nr:InlB B-repeat-containing protein [Bacteroidales bacterium]
MKKILCVSFALISLLTTVAQQAVTLTFTGRNQNNAYVRLDSVRIDNLTRNWSETIVFPDTVYTLRVGVGIDNYAGTDGMQVMPNPFDGKTQVNVYSLQGEFVKMIVMDVSGKICAEYSGYLSAGDNYFEIQLSTPQTYVLSVQTGEGSHSVKMVNTGRSGANRISHIGVGTHNMQFSIKSTSSHGFELGDEMRYQGYTLYLGNFLLSVPETRNQSTDEEIALEFDNINLPNLNSCGVSMVLQNETGSDNRITEVRDHEGNSYTVVQIGSQCWMKENMRATTSPRTGLSMVENPASTTSTAERRAYYYGNDINNASDGYGLLYNWNAAMDSENSPMIRGLRRGICPEGWHVPKREEWITLRNYMLDYYMDTCTTNAGYTSIGFGWALAANVGWQASSNSNGCGLADDLASNNASGFSGLPAGYNAGSNFYGRYGTCEFWSSSVSFSSLNVVTGYYYLALYSSGLQINTASSYYGEALRCIRDGKTYTLHFDANGGTGVMDDEIFLVGIADYISECGFTRGQYGCTGWNTMADGSGTGYALDDSLRLTSDMTLYAQWGTRYTLSFDANGGTGSMNPQTFVSGLSNPQAISPNNFNRTLYVFDGWNTNAAGTGMSYANGDSIALTQNMTLYAQWRAASTDAEKNLTSCTVALAHANETQNGTRITAVRDHQNNSYQVVQIGSQCWLKENMRATTSPSTGTNIVELPYVSYSYSGKKAFYYQDDTTSAANGYGLYYNWNAALDTFNVAYGELSTSTDTAAFVNMCVDGYRRGICPEGWHVPTYGEYQQLRSCVLMTPEWLCGSSYEKALAAPAGWSYSTSNCTAGHDLISNNATGFSLLSTSEPRGSTGTFWSSTQYVNNPQQTPSAWMAYISYSGSSSSDWYTFFSGKCPVRCIRDYAIERNPNDGQPCVGAATATDFDGNVYNTVQIGSQCWMKENLRSTHYSDGTALLNVDTIPFNWNSSLDVNYGYYHRSSNYSADTIGLSYLWNSAVHSSGIPNPNVPVQGVCPQGWHVPNVTEWQQLDNYLRTQCAYTTDGSLDLTATSFSAVPAPNFNYQSGIEEYNLTIEFWASNREYYYYPSYFRNPLAKFYGNLYSTFHYVRCLRD